MIQQVRESRSETPRLVLHPETGREVQTHEEFVAALTWVEERLAPLYKVRRHLREEMAERFPPAELPKRSKRTDKQNAIARCPRCGGQLEDDLGS